MAGLATSVGAGAATNSFDQISGADTLLVFGSNTTEGHPIVSLHVQQALRNGSRLIVADPRGIELTKQADVWLNLRPGTNIALLNGMINWIVQQDWQNHDFIDRRTQGFAELVAAVKDYDPDRVHELTGVSPDKLKEAARLYAQADRAMILYGLGVTEHVSGTENAMAIANLCLTCGHIGRPATGIMALRGQNNVQGASDMGPSPHVLSGYQPIIDPDIRAKFEKAWRVSIPAQPGLKSVEMLDEAKTGKFKGLFILGADPGHTDPDLHGVWEALGRLDFLVVCDIFPTETTRFAHVILPGASFAEKEGTFTNGERRVQRVRKAIEPLAGKAEWQMIIELATRMGYPMQYVHPSAIMAEIANLTPIYGGISYERLEKENLQWPCPSPAHPGTSTLYSDLFSRPGGLAQFIALSHSPSGETCDSEFPFLLITGRRREHYNSGSMTRRTAGIMQFSAEELLEINPADARTLKIKEGEMVKIASCRGAIKVKARLTERSQPGMVFLAFHHQDALTNILTSQFRDPITGTPEYKVTAVAIEKL